MDISVVAAAREDDSPVDEPLRVGVLADRLGYREVWAGEGPTWDSFVLAAAIGCATERVALTAGPVPVPVRDPLTIVRGVASVAAALGRPVGVALGTSSKRVVEGVHGRARTRPVPGPRPCSRRPPRPYVRAWLQRHVRRGRLRGGGGAGGSGAGSDTLLAVVPTEAASTVGLVGDASAVRARIDVYAAAGLDEIALVPATAADTAGEWTLTALAA